MLGLPLDEIAGLARVVRHHRAARRLRLEVPGLLTNPSLAARIEARLRRDPELDEVHADPTSGRLLIRYAPGAALLERLRVADGAHGRRPRTSSARRTREHEELAAVPWHAMEIDEVRSRLDVTTDGLDAAATRRRQRRYGANLVEDGEQRSRLGLFYDQIDNFPTKLLLGSSVASALVRDFLDAGAILGTVGIDAAVGYRIERKNEDLLSSWKRLDAGEARVLRAGRVSRIAAPDLVPGDVILCRAGDVVPADARVTRAHRLACDESFLTGESEACEKHPAPVAADAPLAERQSQLFAGARVVSGRGRALVVGTGPSTQSARIRRLIESERVPETPFEKRLHELGREVSVASLWAGAGTAAAGVLRGRGVAASVRSAIALAVAAIPEGLPLVATTGLVQSMQRMRERGMVVRRLVSAETLGGVTVVCADKTGTLTQNRMALEVLDLGYGPLDPSEIRADPEKLFDDPPTLALAAAVLNSDVDVEDGDEARSIVGSSTEQSLVGAAYEAGLDRASLRSLYPRRQLRERNAFVHHVVSVHEDPAGGGLAFVKGAPEQVVKLCSRDLGGPLDEEGRRALLARNARMAEDGLRVLALAWRRLEHVDVEQIDRDWTLIGLMGLRDPLRPDADKVVGSAARAGIRTLILTGDQFRTAEAAARAVGLDGDVLEGRTISQLLDDDEAAARRVLGRAAAIARVTPEEKARIVGTLREMGEIVAMAGDGINDAPALKAADVGIAIGRGATDVSRQAADIVLASEELGAVLAAVGEGRIVQDNLRRAVRYLVATNFAEVVVTLTSTLAFRHDPFNPLRLLWLNLISDSVPAMALALERGSGDELSRPPAPPDAPLISPELRQRVVRDGLGLSAAGVLGMILGGPAVAFQTVAGAEIGYAFSCRSADSQPEPRFLALVGGTAALHLAAMALPPVRAALALPGGLGALEVAGFAGGLLWPAVIGGTGRDERIVRRGIDVRSKQEERR